MIRHLAAAHEVTVAAPIRSRREAENAAALRSYCANVLTGRVDCLTAAARMLARIPTTTPSSFGYFYSSRLRRLIRSELERPGYDLVLGHCSSIAAYIVDAPVPKIIDFGDMDSQKWLAYADHRSFPLSLAYRVEGHKLERLEKRLSAAFDLCLCTTPAELATLRGFGTASWTECIRNGVDSDYFAPAAAAYDRDLICFLGRMDYYPNQQAMLSFCADVFPRLRAQRPALRLAIVGARPARRIRALATLPGVTVTGSVPDVRPLARQAALSVAPLSIARGTQNKILESLAMGVPVVASPVAALGVDAIPGEHFLTANSATEYVAAILRLLDDPAERNRLAAAGRARVLSHHRWSSSMQRLEDLLVQCVGKRFPNGREAKCA